MRALIREEYRGEGRDEGLRLKAEGGSGGIGGSDQLPEKPDPSLPSILDDALACTSGDRRRDYDHALPNHQRIAGYWNAHLKSVGIEGVLTPADVALMMILLKVARQARTPKRDNLVDIAGYARCVAQIEEMEP